MLWSPAERLVVDSEATPDAFRVAVLRTVVPFRKETLPVGTYVPLPCTVAVRVAAWPKETGFRETTKCVVVD